ncbi:MAG TPA: hypothetical protein ENK82_07190 [Campylobacterales bacterium]|nr:hypothetical protein [Campylobacterales bacterium]
MKIIFSLIFLSLFLLSETINEQIHALEDATPEKRVELMNHIKEQLISMNEAERMKTLGALKAKLHPKEEETPSSNHEMGRHNDSKTHENDSMHSKHEIHEKMMQHNQEMYEEYQHQQRQSNTERVTEGEHKNERMREQQGQNTQEHNTQEHNTQGRMP